MEKVGEGTRKSDGGYVSPVSYYEAKNCTNCPLKCLCYRAEGNRRIEISHNLNRHKEHVRKLLTSREGLMHRSKRPIEPEAVFGQIKSNKQYNRFRHFNSNNGKVMMDFAVLPLLLIPGNCITKGKIRPEAVKKQLLYPTFRFLLSILTPNQENIREENFFVPKTSESLHE
jgi:hypothetical protein